LEKRREQVLPGSEGDGGERAGVERRGRVWGARRRDSPMYAHINK
jgi:hypothetical protein